MRPQTLNRVSRFFLGGEEEKKRSRYFKFSVIAPLLLLLLIFFFLNVWQVSCACLCVRVRVCLRACVHGKLRGDFEFSSCVETFFTSTRTKKARGKKKRKEDHGVVDFQKKKGSLIEHWSLAVRGHVWTREWYMIVIMNSLNWPTFLYKYIKIYDCRVLITYRYFFYDHYYYYHYYY